MILKLLQQDYELLSKNLLCDGEENLAFCVCNTIESFGKKVLLLEELFFPKIGIISKSENHIAYSPNSYIEFLEKIEGTNKTIIKIHSHISDKLTFSDIDDYSDLLFHEVVKNFVNTEFFGSMIINNLGHLSLRVYDINSNIHFVESIMVIGGKMLIQNTDTDYKPTVAQEYAINVFGDYNISVMSKLRVAVVGLGGTGSAIFELLCRSSVGELVLIDHDSIESKNLSRLHECNSTDIGKSKVEHFAKKAKLINSNVNVKYLNCKVNTLEGQEMLKTCDVIFGCLDKTFVARTFIDIIKNAYYIPYIDLGLAVHTDNDGHLKSIYSRVSKLIPGFSCVTCNNIVNSETLSSELFSNTELDNEYIQNLHSQHDPQLISYNSLVANIGFNRFLEYIMDYSSIEYNNLEMDLVSFENFSLGNSKKCIFCRTDLGVGDDVNITPYIVKCERKYSRLNEFKRYQIVKENSVYEIEHGVLFIEKHRKKSIFLTFLCPCGCGEHIRLGLSNEFDPVWKVRRKRDLLSVTPSVDAYGLKCKSHFFVINNIIYWV